MRTIHEHRIRLAVAGLFYDVNNPWARGLQEANVAEELGEDLATETRLQRGGSVGYSEQEAGDINKHQSSGYDREYGLRQLESNCALASSLPEFGKAIAEWE